MIASDKRGFMKNAILYLCLFLLSGCATIAADKMNSISLGMTKQEVLGIMGPPVSTSAMAGVELLNYAFSETQNDAINGRPKTPYFIRIVNGKVDAYGRQGDFMQPTK
jgi:outer membrane protein assembly factor BamE (lipoprotein component of BamABCDE complex)